MAVVVEERDVVVDGVGVHFAVGKDNGPKLVLVPGQSMPWQSYLKVLPLLVPHFHVFVVDVRGHGKSEHTPGRYTFSRLGADCVSFIRDVVKAPAIVCGNSSGGIIALEAAATAPDLVRAVVAEDPPLFTTELPRARETWVQSFFAHTVKTLPDLATYFSTLELPTQGDKELMSFPRPLAWVLGGAIRRRQKKNPGAPIDIAWLPAQVRWFVRGLSEYDVDFTRACVDFSMYDLDHAAMLAAVRCPVLLAQAASFESPTLGLVGAMADRDVDRARQVLPSIIVEKINAQHVVHIARPKVYAQWVQRVAQLASSGTEKA